MTDPLNPADDGGLNISDTQDWADPKTTNVARTMALIVFPCIFLALCFVAVVLLLQGKLKMSGTAPKPQPVASSTLPAVVSEKDAEIAHLRGQLLTLQGQATTPAATGMPTTQAPIYSPDPAAIAQLSARLDRIEANQRALAHAAAAANAAAALQAAARTSQPFLSQLALVEPSLNDSNLVAPLRPYAEHGVASEVALAVDFPAVAKRANIAAKADSGDNGLWSKVQHALGSFISIRRTDTTAGQDVDSLLNRAEIQLNNGDLHGAVASLNALPSSAQTAIKPWLDQARARLLVDDTTQRVTEVALSHLSQSSDEATQPLTGGVL